MECFRENPPPSSLSRQQVVSLSQPSCFSTVELTDKRGGDEGMGKEPNIRRRDSLILYKSCNTLWFQLTIPALSVWAPRHWVAAGHPRRILYYLEANNRSVGFYLSTLRKSCLWYYFRFLAIVYYFVDLKKYIFLDTDSVLLSMIFFLNIGSYVQSTVYCTVCTLAYF